MNYKESLEYNFFPASGLVLTDTTKSTVDLVPLQLGFFNTKTWKAIGTGTSYKDVPEIIIAMGSPNSARIDWENANMSIKSIPIQASRLISYRKALPKRPKQMKVAIGWDGVSDCKTLSTVCDTTYSLFVQVEGSPVSRLYAGTPLRERFIYSTGCCTDGVTGTPTDVEDMVDDFVKQINNHKYLSSFIKAQKIVSYTNPPTPDTVAYEQFTLTVADNGTVGELAAIQALYPNATVTRESRNGIFSTYKLVQIATEADPTPYTTGQFSVITNCDECPSGYTLTGDDIAHQFKIVRVDDGSATALTTVQTDYTEEMDSTTIIRISYSDGKSTYVGRGSSATTPLTQGATSGDTVTYLAYIAPLCVSDSAVTTAWVEGDALYKVKRTLCLTVGDSPCDATGADILADLQAYYEGSTSIDADSLAQDTNGTCANIYTADQYSDNLLTEDECYEDIAIFTDPTPYKGFSWKVCCGDEDVANEVDKIGIVLTGAYVDTKFGRCAFEYDDFVELDIPRIHVRQGEGLDVAGKCATPWPVTILQQPEYPTGVGVNVLKSYIGNMAAKGQIYEDSPRWQEIYGFDYKFIDIDKYYKFYYLEFEGLDKYLKNTGHGGMDMRTTITFAFEETVDTSTFEAVLESWINSARPDLIDGNYTTNLLR